MHRTHLLLIDPQNDFCDLPEELCPIGPDGRRLSPALPVPGSHRDMLRLTGWLGQNLSKVDAITVTMDHHHRLDIAHPGFWRTRAGDAVAPFTQISASSLKAGEFAPAPGLDRERALAYLEALEADGRFAHMVWPVHCQIGTWGQCVHPGLQAMLDIWEDATGRPVAHVLKGESPWTEHYSALQAEVPDPADPSTGMNRTLLDRLATAEALLVAGEAGSHCVRATVEHLMEHWPHDASRIVLVSDGMSPVSGFEPVQARFLADMAARGLRIASTRELDRI